MEYLAIRDDANKNVYYYNTKGEKGRILSKFPNASNRVFMEEDKLLAMEWAGVDRIATEEENNWAITKKKVDAPIQVNPATNNNPNETIVGANPIIPAPQELMDISTIPEQEQSEIKEESTPENNTPDMPSIPDIPMPDVHVDISNNVPAQNSNPNNNSSFMYFLDRISNNHTKGENQDNNESNNATTKHVEMQSQVQPDNTRLAILGETKEVVSDDKQLKHIPSDFEKIIELYKKSNVKIVDVQLKNGMIITILVDDLYYISNLGDSKEFANPLAAYNEKALRDEIVAMVEKCKIGGKKGDIFNNHINFEMFSKVTKTKYLVFGDLVFVANGSPLVEIIVNKDTMKYEIGNVEGCKNITFNTANISTILPHNLDNFSHLVREKEFTVFIKRTLKSIEKQKELEKSQNLQKA